MSPATGKSQAQGSGGPKVSVPFHRIIFSASGQLALLLSASRAVLLKIHTDNSNKINSVQVLGSLACPTAVPSTPYSSEVLCFPRHAAISPDERFVAVIGDDKVLHVWDISSSSSTQDANALEQGKQIMVRPVPKRANVIFWEDTSRHIVIGDRFGDVRVFPIDDSSSASATVASVLARLGSNGSAPKGQPKGIKKQTGAATAPDTAAGAEDEDDEDGDDPQDPWSAPRVGHASMLTAVLLLGTSPTEPESKIARHIVTADRDEHIRISRWGPKRAGWVVENYLLGSTAFVGALALLPSHLVKGELSSTASAGDRAGLLLASDGGRVIRMWDYLQNDSASQIIASVDVSAAILPHTVMSGKNKSGGRGAKKVKGDQKLSDDQLEQMGQHQRLVEENSKLAITQLVLFQSEGQTYVLFTAEGSTAFFTLSITAFSAARGRELVDVSAQVQVVTLSAPILDLTLQACAAGGPPRLLAVLDTLSAVPGRTNESSALVCYEYAQGSWTEVTGIAGPILEPLVNPAVSLIDKIEPGQSKKLTATYYDALKTYPKLAGESSSQSSMPMTSAGVYEVSPLYNAAAAKRKENMDRIRAAAEAERFGSSSSSAPDAGGSGLALAPRKKVKKEPKEGKVFEIMVFDEQVGGGPRKKGKGKAVEPAEEDVQMEAEAEADDADEVEVDVAQKETDVLPEAEGAINGSAQKLSMEERLAKMKDLRKKMSDSARANRKDVIAEQGRHKNGGQARDPQKKSWKLQKAERILEERDIKETGEDVDRVRAWGYSVEDNEAWEKKLEEKEKKRDKGPVDFNTAAERSYQRQVRMLKPDMREYERTMAEASVAAGSSSSSGSQALIRTANSAGALIRSDASSSTTADALSYGTHKPSEVALERLAAHINNEHEVRENRSRKRPVDPDAEVTYINEKNRRFNEKAERFFGKYTKEIRESFERGTAL
ncbi:unnamed protein product [Tilletia controversa]|uniref:Pre-mRNA-splicing factor SYF2 n=3 Tax=Tilletia TaxID=13289 RepID=A0A8X7MZ33_9BASI|nr:hypothetical protein CF336_g6173 [Tilletia laevis]KAE8190682.1 hypothetical protein CF328_g5901 [Tilletia controversa]KAE8261793.1 hypothetical protein A4X03_0g2961 [Tilletia caries]KAE8255304.1 hypothetical protein A4X06_0g486 [Tilletia controversa]CAD6897487.1 unnamed protein product [Tilletia laevis]